MLRLQGFPDTFKIVVSYQAMRRLTGNSVAVAVIEAVAGKMIEALKKRQIDSNKGCQQLNLLEALKVWL